MVYNTIKAIEEINNNLAKHTHTFLNIGLAYKDYDIEIEAGFNGNTIWAWETYEALAATMIYTYSQGIEPCICMIDNTALETATKISIRTLSGEASVAGGAYRVRLWYIQK